MSNLTKEVCEKSLKAMTIIKWLDSCTHELEESAIIVLNQLINEHFGNPPLEFEELKPNMWVWVDGLKFYYKIKEIVTSHREPYVEVYDGDGDYFLLKFKNDFYAKEVKDDE